MTKPEISILSAQPFLRGMPHDQLAALAELCTHVMVPAGQLPLMTSSATCH
jgi:hypothetical protein